MLQVDRCEPVHKRSMLLLQKLRSGKFGQGGLQEDIRPFLLRHDTAPLHTIFCLDDSGSMQNEWPSVQAAVKAFFQIRRELGSADDKFSCVQFSHNTHQAYREIGYDAALSTELIFRNGCTSFANALSALEPIVKNSPANLEVVIVFMTDGQSDDVPDIAKFLTACAKSDVPLGSAVCIRRDDGTDGTLLRARPTISRSDDAFVAPKVEITSDDRLQLLQITAAEGCAFSLVRTSSGVEGYVQSKYIALAPAPAAVGFDAAKPHFGSFYGIAFKNNVDHSSFEKMVKELNGQMKRAKDVAELRQEFCRIAQDPIASHSK
jgi:hypothetical protein